MNSLPIIALIGMAVLVTATVGFGQTLTTSPDFNLIGASDNNAVPAARANITELVWTEEVSILGAIEIDELVFTIGNEDIVNHHDFSVCVVIEKQDGTFNPAAGSAPDCITTGDIGPSLNGTGNSLPLTTPMNVTDIVDISFSIEEIE